MPPTIELSTLKATAYSSAQPAGAGIVSKGPEAGFGQGGFKQALGEQLQDAASTVEDAPAKAIVGPSPESGAGNGFPWTAAGSAKDGAALAVPGRLTAPISRPEPLKIEGEEAQTLDLAAPPQTEAAGDEEKATDPLSHAGDAPGAKSTTRSGVVLVNADLAKVHPGSVAVSGSADIAAAVPVVASLDVLPRAQSTAKASPVQSATETGRLANLDAVSHAGSTEQGPMDGSLSPQSHGISKSTQLPGSEGRGAPEAPPPGGMRPNSAAAPAVQEIPTSYGVPGPRTQSADGPAGDISSGKAGEGSGREAAPTDQSDSPPASQPAGSAIATRSLREVQLPQSARSVLSSSASLAPLHSAAGTGAEASRGEGASLSTLSHLEHAAAGEPVESGVSIRAADPYQRMDQIAPAPVSALSVGANRVAVGLHDPSLGWVEIKTQSTAGQIAAAVVTSSAQSHQALAGQLPSMAQFLSEHYVKLGSITVEQQSSAGNPGNGTADSGEGSQSYAGQDAAPSHSGAASPGAGLNPGTDTNEEYRPLSYISVMV